MKILVVSHLHPHRKNIITDTFNKFFSSLKNIAEHEEVWLVFQPDRFESRHEGNRAVIDIHDFDDAVSLLKGIRPDCVFIEGMDRVQAAMNVAARHLGIPVLTVFMHGIHYNADIRKGSAAGRLRWMLNSFFSDKVPSDTAEKKRFLRKGGFILYKLGFFYRTLRHMDQNFFRALAIPCREVFLIMAGRNSRYHRLPDYYFLPDDSMVSALLGDGIDRESIFVTGNPFWDDFEVNRDPEYKRDDPGGRIRVLVLTSPLYEHGHWSYRQRNKFIASLVSSLGNNPRTDIAFKIHPSSEDRQEYSDILGDVPCTARILQSGNIPDIIDEFDVVVSFGPTSGQTEVIASGARLVLVKTDPPSGLAQLVNEGMSAGIVTSCESPALAGKAVLECLERDIRLSDAFVAERDRLFPREKPSAKMAGIVAWILSRADANAPARPDPGSRA